jgi:hypothetical protein
MEVRDIAPRDDRQRALSGSALLLRAFRGDRTARQRECDEAAVALVRSGARPQPITATNRASSEQADPRD